MTAVEEWMAFRDDSHYPNRPYDEDQIQMKADAAIAELEAENKRLAQVVTITKEEREQAEAELAALGAQRCETCQHAGGQGRYNEKITFEKDGYALCSKVVFNADPFWDGDDAHWNQKTDKPAQPAWVIDGSDYWAALHVTPHFSCSEWEART